MAIAIFGYKTLRETPKALLITWYDTNQLKRVQAWVPKSQTERQGTNVLYITKLCYKTLKTTPL